MRGRVGGYSSASQDESAIAAAPTGPGSRIEHQPLRDPLIYPGLYAPSGFGIMGILVWPFSLSLRLYIPDGAFLLWSSKASSSLVCMPARSSNWILYLLYIWLQLPLWPLFSRTIIVNFVHSTYKSLSAHVHTELLISATLTVPWHSYYAILALPIC